MKTGAQNLDAGMHWLQRLRNENLSEADIAAWLAWYQASEANRKAFAEMQEFWGQLGALPQTPDGAELIEQFSHPHQSGAVSRRLRAQRWLAAAMVAGVAVLGAALLRPLPAPPPAAALPALVRQTALPDGSKVELAARTGVTVRYSEHERLLEMRDGAAYFTVAANRARPFIVSLGEVQVRAVGTAFNIRRAGARIEVTVAEGVVEVLHPGQSAAQMIRPVRVKAGQALSLAGPGAAPRIAAVTAGSALAWREGRLEYAGEPLAAVIADVNRYTERPLTIPDPAVARLMFTGTVFVDSIEDWLQALPGQFPVAIVTRGKERLLVAD